MHSTLRPLVALVLVVALAAAQNGHMTITMYRESSRCTGPAQVLTRALPLCMPESGAYFTTCKKKSTVRIHRRLLTLIILLFAVLTRLSLPLRVRFHPLADVFGYLLFVPLGLLYVG
jgi:hypothetical protein